MDFKKFLQVLILIFVIWELREREVEFVKLCLYIFILILKLQSVKMIVLADWLIHIKKNNPSVLTPIFSMINIMLSYLCSMCFSV